MSTFTLSHELLEKLCRINQFNLPNLEILFIGVRGAVISDSTDPSFKDLQSLNVIDINYVNPRCTILQWRRRTKQLAAFPASTVPNQANVKTALAGTENANCLLTGYYQDYRKGVHKAGTATAHDAFRQNAVHPFRRTTDDLDFEGDDRIEYNNPHDNIHCGWFQGMSSSNFASAGCQVIMGFPKCERPDREKNVGPWKVFHENAYGIPQDSFPYILVSGLEVLHIASNGITKPKLRFGSSGPNVETLQQILKDKHFYEGAIDGEFGERTVKAVISFQQQRFGNQGADGIVGPITAEELGIELVLV